MESVGVAALTAADATTVKLTYNKNGPRPGIVRNGESFSYEQNQDAYRPVGGDAPIRQVWQKGT